MQAIAEALCRDIPMNVCVTAYNKSFECSRIKELAGMFPDLSEHFIKYQREYQRFTGSISGRSVIITGRWEDHFQLKVFCRRYFRMIRN